jgi:hypothetical protein
MTDDWCDVMDMGRAGCVHCRPAAERARLDQTERDMSRPLAFVPAERVGRDGFEIGPYSTAAYSGRCKVRGAGCGGTIERGDAIRLVAGGWLHAECVDR